MKNAKQVRTRRPAIEALEERRLFAYDAFSTAFAVGTLDGRVTKTGTVTSTDTKDYYKVTIPRSGALGVSLTGNASNADLYVYNGSQVQVASSKLTTYPEKAVLNVSAGTYYVMVSRVAGTTIGYTLDLHPDYAGNEVQYARNLGTLGTTPLSAKDFVGTAGGQTDTSDIYKFTVGATTNVNFNLGGMTGNADLTILNSSGGTVGSSFNTGTTAENLTKSLMAGTYYAKVTGLSTANTNYTLNIGVATIVDGVGNLRTSAKALGIISGTKQITGTGSTLPTEAISPTDLDDVFSFVVGEAGTIKAQLTNLTGNLNVQFENSAGTILSPKGVNTGTTSESISLSVQPGLYYVRVFQGSTGVTSQYKLTLTAPTDPGTTAATSVEPPFLASGLGFDLYGAKYNVGTNDTTDWFNLPAYSSFSGISVYVTNADDVDLYIYNQKGTLVKSSVHASLADEGVTFTDNGVDTYYVVVKKGALSTSSFYDLRIQIDTQL